MRASDASAPLTAGVIGLCDAKERNERLLYITFTHTTVTEAEHVLFASMGTADILFLGACRPLYQQALAFPKNPPHCRTSDIPVTLYDLTRRHLRHEETCER